MEVLANRLKWLREKKRLVQKEVASKVGITLSGYQQFEYGKSNPKLETLINLCDFFEVSADFLLGRDNHVNELDKIKDKINEINGKIISFDSILESLRNVTSELREEMIESAKEKGFSHADTMEISRKLDEVLKDYSQFVEKKRRHEDNRNSEIITYIRTLLDVPESEPFNDVLINEYTPFKADLQFNLFDEVELILYGAGIGNIGTYYVFTSEGEAMEEMEILLKRLNGFSS